jgi:hypothetical protein
VRATFFPLVAIVVGLVGVVAAWRHPVVGDWATAARRLSFAAVLAAVVAWAGGWRGAAAAAIGVLGAPLAGALGPAAAAALALLTFGAVAWGFLSFGYEEATWRAFAAIAAGLAAGAALARRDGDGASGRYAAHTAALAGAVIAGAAAPTVANRLDAVALPAFLATAAVLAGALGALLLRLSGSAFVARAVGVGVFLFALWGVAGWFDPVLVGGAGRPLPASRPLVTAVAGAVTGILAVLALRLPAPHPWRTMAFLTVLAAAAFAALAVAGLYGVGLVAVTALAVMSLVDPTATV